ncbi:MAG: hypothetical protein A2284_08900 [Deltaproteobacteria bacterium RIFOXYA12_FULL_61_11]|nr:MAG: hypothetical protein A2284_08900 [Deltaproteobacteria bacterium RIFOXYA12_FULL_61_11]
MGQSFCDAGAIEAQGPSGAKNPVVVLEGLEELLGMGSAATRRSAVDGREIVMLFRDCPQILAPGFDHLTIRRLSLASLSPSANQASDLSMRSSRSSLA